MNEKKISILILFSTLIIFLIIPSVNALQDFTNYTEVDSASEMTVNSTHIYVNGIFSDGATKIKRLYISNPTNHDSYDVEFNLYVVEMSSTAERGGIGVFTSGSTTVQDINTLDNSYDFSGVIIRGYNSTHFEIYIRNVDSTGTYPTIGIFLPYSTWFHIRYNHTSASTLYSLYIYNGKDKTVLRDTESINGGSIPDYGGTNYEFYALDNWGGTVTGTHSEFYVSDMHIELPLHLSDSNGGGGGTNYTKQLNQIISTVVEISKNTNSRITTITTLVEINKVKYEYLQDIISGIMIEKNGFMVYSSFWGKSSLLNASIQTEIDNWLFENEVYELTAYFNGTNDGRITLSDTIHTIDFIYQNYTGFRETAFLEVRNQDGTLINDIVAQSLETTIEERTLNITKVTWKFILNQEIIDCVDRYLTYKTIDINGLSTTGTILNKNYNIYNLGGLSEYLFFGTGGRIKGGDTLELVVKEEGDYAQSYVYFRKLQAVNMLFEVWGNESVATTYFDVNDGIEIRFEMEFWYNNQWNDGWEVRINPTQKAEVGTLGVDSDASWVELNVRWYYDNVFVKQDNIVVYHNGYDKDRFPTENRYYMLWLDMWFNRMNASTVVGGRVNGYYNGMKELGTWWFGYGDFRPFTGNTTYSMYFDDLTVNDEIIPSTELELMRFRTYITKTSDLNDGRWNSIKNYQILEWKLADDRMMGINTPPFTEAKDISIPKTTILTPLITAIQSIGQFMWSGVVSAGRVLIGAIDSFMLYLGFSITLSTMLNFVGIQFDSLLFYITTVTEYASDITYIFTSLVLFIISIIGYVINAFIWVIIWVLPLPIHIITFFVAILKGGVWVYGDYITLDFAIGFPIIDGMMQLLPMFLVWSYFMWLFFGNDEREDDLTGLPRRVIETFRYIREAQTEVFWVFTRMYNSVISLYNFIRSHIPFLSSGGGEQNEQ